MLNDRTSPNRWRSGGHVPDAVLVDAPRLQAGDVRALERHGPAGRLAQPDDRLDQLVLAVAGDARDAEDLPGPDLEVDAVDDFVAAVVADRQPAHVEGRSGRVRFAAIDGQRHLAADHQLGEVFLVRLGWDALADDLAAPDDRDPVRDLEDLVQLVADEDDAVALGRQAPQDLEDLLRLLRRQHRGRFVEDEDLRVAVERLQDLDPLLPADRQRADLDLRVDFEAEPATEVDDALVGLLAIEETAADGGLLAEDDVLGDAQDRDEHEVLMDHADPAADRVRRPGQVDLGAVDEDLALVRAREPVEDVHQGRLARAVLAEQRVDLTRADVQVDRLVGDDARIALGDAPHLESGGANLLGLRRHRCLGCVHHDGYDERVGRGADPLELLGPGQLPIGGAGVLPHSGAGGQVLMDPSFMPARAASILVWMSAGSLLAAS